MLLNKTPKQEIKPSMDGNLISWYININYGLLKPLRWQKPIFDVLASALMGNVSKILISAPPQHGKTMLTIEAFTSYYMVNNPDDKVIVTAYSQQRANKYGLRLRNIIDRFGGDTRYKPHLSQSQRSKSEFIFDYPYKGELLASGSHGSIMGNPANLIVIDDPIKELREATSKLMQENLDDWFVGSVNTRLRKNDIERRPILLVVAQRLNKYDLQGLLQDKYKVLDGLDAIRAVRNKEYIPSDTVLNLNFPALCDDPARDLLHRRQGEALWSNHKSREELLIDRRMMGDYRFKTIMQGNPQNMEDYLFTDDMFYNEDHELTCTVDIQDVPLINHIGRFWDTAAKNKNNKAKRGGDYYSGSLAGYHYPTDYLYVFDNIHGKANATVVADLLKSTAWSDGRDRFTYIAQEGGSLALTYLTVLQEELQKRGYTMYFQTEKGDKQFRSILLQNIARDGRLKFVTQPHRNNDWIKTVIDELTSFDGSESNDSKNKHDDIVDSLSSAANWFYMNRQLYSPY